LGEAVPGAFSAASADVTSADVTSLDVASLGALAPEAVT
jgi:hypothetical protein